MSPTWVMLLEAVGASGITAVMVAALTAWSSRGKTPGDPNGVRTRLQDEVNWLRQQIAIAQARGFIANGEQATPSPVAEADPPAPPPSSV